MSREGGMSSTMVYTLRAVVRSKQTWCFMCLVVAATVGAFLIRVVALMLHFQVSQSTYYNPHSFRVLQPRASFATPAAAAAAAVDVPHPAGAAVDHASTPPPATKLLLGGGAGSKQCDMSVGDWVPDHALPAYSNETCRHIQDTQNCMRNGRQDSRFLFWKWKPRGCDTVVRGNAAAFLRAMRGLTLAFVGDSIARNQFQSLLCMLEQVEKAVNTFHSEDDKSNHWLFPSYAFTLTVHWSPFLVRHTTYSTPNNKILMDIDLDVPDPSWRDAMGSVDVMVISSGQWYYRNAVYREGGHIIGCHHCEPLARGDTIKEMGFYNAYRKALRTVFKELPRGKAVVLRTFAPDHFENGGWDSGGTCPRTVPGGVAISEMNWMMHEIEITQMDMALSESGNSNLQLHLLDITELAQVRSDGHPGPYRNFNPYGKEKKGNKVQIDCLHWCLPGPIDTWNEILMELLQH